MISKHCVPVLANGFGGTFPGIWQVHSPTHRTGLKVVIYNFCKLNSAEHEILNSHKYKNIKKFSFFSGSDEPSMLFFLLINVNIYEQKKFHAQLS